LELMEVHRSLHNHIHTEEKSMELVEQEVRWLAKVEMDLVLDLVEKPLDLVEKVLDLVEKVLDLVEKVLDLVVMVLDSVKVDRWLVMVEEEEEVKELSLLDYRFW
jgi:hypothetical protein